jgi:hypothetical protein
VLKEVLKEVLKDDISCDCLAWLMFKTQSWRRRNPFLYRKIENLDPHLHSRMIEEASNLRGEVLMVGHSLPGCQESPVCDRLMCCCQFRGLTQWFVNRMGSAKRMQTTNMQCDIEIQGSLVDAYPLRQVVADVGLNPSPLWWPRLALRQRLFE